MKVQGLPPPMSFIRNIISKNKTKTESKIQKVTAIHDSLCSVQLQYPFQDKTGGYRVISEDHGPGAPSRIRVPRIVTWTIRVQGGTMHDDLLMIGLNTVWIVEFCKCIDWRISSRCPPKPWLLLAGSSSSNISWDPHLPQKEVDVDVAKRLRARNVVCISAWSSVH